MEMRMDKNCKKIFLCCRRWTIILCGLGFLLSAYSVFVSDSKEQDPNYKALCDISEKISCSGVLTSKYSKGFGVVAKILGDDHPIARISNGFYGLFYYAILMLFSMCPFVWAAKPNLVMSIMSVVVSAYLGYILLYILEDLCVVCVTTYVINILLFMVSVRNYRALKKAEELDPLEERNKDFVDFVNQHRSKKRV